MRRIAGGRLSLEPQEAGHAEALFAVLADPALYVHENEPPPSVEWLRERFARLESRRSPDGLQRWLNWVIVIPGAGPAGYVQATVLPGGRALVAYVLGSAFWGRGLAREAVRTMIVELERQYGVRELHAVLKRSNLRSLRLLEALGFAAAPPEGRGGIRAAADELHLWRPAGEA